MHTSVEYSDACLSNLNICMRSINTFLTLLEAYLCCAMTDSSHACSITKTTTWLNPKFESVRLQFSCHLFMLAGGNRTRVFIVFAGVGWGGVGRGGVGWVNNVHVQMHIIFMLRYQDLLLHLLTILVLRSQGLLLHLLTIFMLRSQDLLSCTC